MRLKQICQATCCEGFSEVTNAPREVDIVVDGKCNLWKLNKIIAECFDASDGVLKKNKNATILGSHFAVSRPLKPGQCNKVVICSEASALRIGSASDFVDDRCYTVSQLFRGKSMSSRLALGEMTEATHQVTFASPLLSAEVDVSLYDFLGSRYARKPLSQIVHSSFLSVEELQGKNLVMQVFL